jgi:hypothetical protein
MDIPMFASIPGVGENGEFSEADGAASVELDFDDELE